MKELWEYMGTFLPVEEIVARRNEANAQIVEARLARSIAKEVERLGMI